MLKVLLFLTLCCLIMEPVTGIIRDTFQCKANRGDCRRSGSCFTYENWIGTCNNGLWACCKHK